MLIDDFIRDGKVFFEFRDYPFLGPESKSAAKAAYCAAEQDRFWDFHNTVFENQGKAHNGGAYSDARLRLMAQETGLDTGAFDTCYTAGETAAAVDAMEAEAQGLGVNSTPSVFVDGVKIDWNGYDTLKPAIEEALKKKGA